MICIASSTGVTTRRNRSERPAQTPSGMPIRSDKLTDAKVSANVRTLGSHTPVAANETNAASTISAARRPPKRSTTRVPSAVVPAQVSLRRNDVSQPTRWSRKLATPLNTRNTMLGCGTLRLLLSHAWKLSRSCASEFHVSAAGHVSWFFQMKNAMTIAIATPIAAPALPRHQTAGAGAEREPAACATAISSRLRSPSAPPADRRQHRLLVDDADDPSVID